MIWLAALRPADMPERGTLAEAMAHATSTVSGDDFTDVVTRGRAGVEPGICCDIYHLPPNELVAPDARVDAIVEAIQTAAHTGRIGDGKIFVTPVETAIRIRTGESGENAL